MGNGSSQGGGSGAIVQVLVAIIGVTGVISAALFANWDKIFGRDAQSATPQETSKPGPETAAAGGTASPSSKPVEPAKPGPVADTAQREAAPDAGAASADEAPSAAGIWRDSDGYGFDVSQAGTAITFTQYLNGVLVGSGSGRIDGRAMTYIYRTAEDQGRCVAELSRRGDQINGRCTSADGSSWPFTVTR